MILGEFKLIAIRPLSGCDKRFLRVLQQPMIYKFCQDYQFENSEGHTIADSSSEQIESITCDLKQLQLLYNVNEFQINVSAIVGQNGGGKSSLIELLFISIHCISVKMGTLPEGVITKDRLHVEIVYQLHGNLYILRIDSLTEAVFEVFKFIKREDSLTYYRNKTISNDNNLENYFFYTVAVNYSIYGLNPAHVGNWINDLFHKNDGYQTPIVINPYREDGKIDINIELYLAKQRLLVNIIRQANIPNNIRGHYLTNSQRVEAVKFKVDNQKIQYAFTRDKENITFEQLFKTDPKDDILDEVYLRFCNGKKPHENVKFKEEVELYIIKKIIKIARTYVQYNGFFKDKLVEHVGIPGSTVNENIDYKTHFQYLSNYIISLNNDRSHLTFKLRQAINYLMNDVLRDDQDAGFLWKVKNDKSGEPYEELEVNLSKLTERIGKMSSDALINFIPPSFFDIDLQLTSEDGSLSPFSSLSSGEQQLIHSIQSVLYHLVNLDSVFQSPNNQENRLTYGNVNLIFDEVELYFHPEFQRKFISEFLGSLKRTELKNVKNFNVLFSTHSPFILSDIVHTNILCLNNGLPSSFDEDIKTFGSNIHDLLRNEFFLKDGFMGEQAKGKINALIDSLRVQILKNKQVVQTEISQLKELRGLNKVERINKEEIKQIIDIVGEPVLYNSLLELYVEAYPEDSKSFIDQQLEFLMKLKNRRI